MLWADHHWLLLSLNQLLDLFVDLEQLPPHVVLVGELSNSICNLVDVISISLLRALYVVLVSLPVHQAHQLIEALLES